MTEYFNLSRGIGESIKLATYEAAGPASYDATNNLVITFSELKGIVAVIASSITGGYKADNISVSGNAVTIIVEYFDYDLAGDGTAIEIPDATDLSGETVRVTVIGY